MRQNQHNNKRMRGRNRKGPNPLSRNFESNGPDIKIRGNAGHIAEKYTTLARDAQVSGDRVLAESYLQHAEHYNRIIMTAQAQVQAQAEQNQPNYEARDSNDSDDRDNDGDDDSQSGGGRDRRKSASAPAAESVDDGGGEQAGQNGAGSEDDGESRPRASRSRRSRRGPRVKADGEQGETESVAAAKDSGDTAAETVHS